MLTEAQMRSSPACFSGSQPTVSPKGVIYRPQRILRNLHLYTVSSSCRPSAKLLGTQEERTRQGPCAAARRETREESVELPSREELCGNEPSRNLSRASLHTAALGGIIAVLSALAVPPPADAAEALPLEFLSRFLVRPLVLPFQCEYGSGTPAEDLLCEHIKSEGMYAGPSAATGAVGTCSIHTSSSLCRDDSTLPHSATGSL